MNLVIFSFAGFHYFLHWANQCRNSGRRSFRRLSCLFAVMVLIAPAAFAQQSSATSGKEVYDQIKSFSLGGGSAAVNNLVFTRDRVRMTFTGNFYFATPVEGHVTGAVFIGEGKFSAAAPPSDFEKANVKRLLGEEVVESDFKTAVLRFSDDTFDKLGQNRVPNQADQNALKLAKETDPRLLKEMAVNLPARVALSILNQEKPGFFFAHFDGGKRGRFSFLLDYQNRLPVSNFNLNAGEKGLIIDYYSDFHFNEVLMAFHALEDYQRGIVSYSDLSDLIDVKHYDMDLDLREHKKYLRLRSRLVSQARSANVRAVPFKIGESLGEFADTRLKKQMRLKSVRLGASELAFAQEDWEGGFTVFLPAAASKGQTVELEMTLEGDAMYDPDFDDTHYPLETSSWYPRHGYLDRSTFDLTFHHPKKLRIATIGSRLSEEADPESAEMVVTKYRMPHPVALITFALAAFERHTQTVKWEQSGLGDPIPLEFNSLARSRGMLKVPFVMAEMDISIRYFTKLFGPYPYPTFNSAFHPRPFAQGFPSLLLLPTTNWDDSTAYTLIAHETAHQWWGDIVTWRSYRDQWLSEGFAEYSAILYIGPRAGADARDQLIEQARESLMRPVRTVSGSGKGRLVDVGPISLGHRLNTSKTLGAYRTLIYNKGALVLRMLHFLFTDPATSNGDAFFAMMTDFVNRYRHDVASTDDFRMVANEHFVKTPIARTYGMTSLNWFFNQLVHGSELPSYRMDYELQDLPDGKAVITGSVTQEDVPNNWTMILPVKLSFGQKRIIYTTVAADGPKTTFSISLPARPVKVELDPQHWVLSEKISTKGG